MHPYIVFVYTCRINVRKALRFDCIYIYLYFLPVNKVRPGIWVCQVLHKLKPSINTMTIMDIVIYKFIVLIFTNTAHVSEICFQIQGSWHYLLATVVNWNNPAFCSRWSKHFFVPKVFRRCDDIKNKLYVNVFVCRKDENLLLIVNVFFWLLFTSFRYKQQVMLYFSFILLNTIETKCMKQ